MKRHLSFLHKYANFTIRQLKEIVSQVHKSNDCCILNKAMIRKICGVDKSWSRLTKAELIKMLIALDSLKNAVPKARWQIEKLTNRIAVQSANRQVWATYIACADEYEAFRGLQSLVAECDWVVMRRTNKQLNAPWELKAWNLDPLRLSQLIEQSRSLPLIKAA